jgi:hypothetical protein
MANIYHQAGFLHSALVASGKALEISPNMVATHFTLANIYASMVTIFLSYNLLCFRAIFQEPCNSTIQPWPYKQISHMQKKGFVQFIVKRVEKFHLIRSDSNLAPLSSTY